jgi:hypothetical protein
MGHGGVSERLLDPVGQAESAYRGRLEGANLEFDLTRTVYSDGAPAMRLPGMTLRRWTLAAAILALVFFACLRTYRQVIPRGADRYPFWFASDDGPSFVSPDGQRAVHVVFNDAGGMHSGFHWTWLIVDDLLLGRTVVAEGFSLPAVRRREVSFPFRWVDDRTFSAGFVAGRHDPKPVEHAVRL